MMMNKALKSLPSVILCVIGAVSVWSCGSSDDQWSDYKEWRETNQNWLAEQEHSGKYTKVVPTWNKNLYVLMRWINDLETTKDNLTPMLTSQVAVKYKGTLYNGEPFDSTYAVLPDSTVNVTLSSVISGWPIAMEQMHVGDEVELLIPYEAAYGSSSVGKIPPYSALCFRLHLRDIPAYEIKS